MSSDVTFGGRVIPSSKKVHIVLKHASNEGTSRMFPAHPSYGDTALNK